MAIRIVWDKSGNCLNLFGSAGRPSHYNATLTAEVDSVDNTLVNVINTVKTNGGSNFYELFNVPYTEFQRGDGTSFANATEAAAYISTQGNTHKSKGGYEFTGGFTDRTTGQAGASDIGTDVEYTSAMASAGQWLRFGFDSTQQNTNDAPYWADEEGTAPGSGTTDYQGVGSFSGFYMPAGVTSMFNYTDNTAYNAAVSSGSLQYTAATGSYDMTQLAPGDLCSFRFDFNVTPQQPNTTVEVGLIWQTRDASDVATFTFALTGEPIFFGDVAGETFLNRPTITAYLASQEDVNARALPAIRASEGVFVQPLTTLYTVIR